MVTAVPARKQLLRLFAAWLLPVLVGLAQRALWAEVWPYPWFAFFLAVFFATLLGGFWGGVGASLLSSLIVWHFFLPPENSFALASPTSALSLILFFVVGVAFSLFQQRQRQRDEQYHMLFENAADGIIVLDANARVVDANPAFCAMQGRPRAEIVGAALEALAEQSPAQWHEVSVDFRRAGNVGFERQLHRADGASLPVEVTVSPLHGGRRLAVVRDISERKRMDAALHKSEEKFSKFFHSSPIAEAVTRLDTGELVEVNQAFVEQYGYMRAELLGRTTLEVGLYSEDVRARLLETVRHDSPVRNVEITLLHKSGAAKHCLFSAEVLDLPDERLLLVSLVDITERQQLSAALRSSEERLRYALDATSEGLWDRDLVTDDEAVNDRWYIQLGFAPGEVQPTAAMWLSMLHPEDAAATVRSLNDYLQGRRPEYRCEHRVITKSGEVRWFRSVGKVVEWDAGGKPLRIVGTNADITERKQAEQLLRDNEERFRLVVENSPNPILIWSETGAVLYASPAVATTLGRSSVMVAERIARLHHLAADPGSAEVALPMKSQATPEDTSVSVAHVGGTKLADTHRWFQATEGIQYCLQHPGERVQTEERMALPSGEMRDLVVVSQGFAHSLSGAEVVSVVHDITEHRTLQRLLEQTNADLEQQVAARTAELQTTVADLHRANTAKDAFLAAVSHELRTPLTGILSMSELLQSEMFGALNPNQHKYLGAILESTHRLVAAVNSILIYTNLVAGTTPLEIETCRLHELCAIAVRSLKRKAGVKQQRLAQEIIPFDLEIESNAYGLLQVIKELVDNAIKFTPEGGSIELQVTGLPEQAAVSIVVTDNGIGMSEEQVACIFRPFAQGDQSLARRFEGLGLGLAYAYEMVTRLGGTIDVTSAPGEGSRFTIILPVAPPPRHDLRPPRED